MVHSSNPRLMTRVLDTVVHLCEGKGSTARAVIDCIRENSKSRPRNLTMQVHRALKHAVNAGLLRHRSGRYKALFTLNPAPDKQSALNESNEGKSAAETEEQPTGGVIPDRKEKNKEKPKNKSLHDKKRKRSRSNQKKRRRRSGSRSRQYYAEDPTEDMRTIRKYKYKEKVDKDRSPRRRYAKKNLKLDVASTSYYNRDKSRRRKKDEEYYSDVSDISEYEDIAPKTRTPAYDECKNEGGGKRRKSVSRNQSPQRKQSQHLQSKHSHDDVKSNKGNLGDRKNDDQNDEPDQDVNKDCDSNNS